MDATKGTAGLTNKRLTSATATSATAAPAHRCGKRGARSLGSRGTDRHYVSRHRRRTSRRRWLGVSPPAHLNRDAYRAWQRWIEQRKSTARNDENTISLDGRQTGRDGRASGQRHGSANWCWVPSTSSPSPTRAAMGSALTLISCYSYVLSPGVA